MLRKTKPLALLEMASIIISYFLLEILMSSLLHDLGYKFNNDDPRLFVISVIAIGLIISTIMTYRGTTYSELLTNKKFNTKTSIVISIITGITISSASIWLLYIYNLLLKYDPYYINEMRILHTILSGRYGSLLYVCIILPVMMEVLFRGLILGGLLKSYSPLKSIALSSIAYSLFHLSIASSINLIILGCFYGLIFYKTKNVINCILASCLYNSISICYYMNYTDITNSNINLNSIPIIASSFLISAFGLSSMIIITRNKTAVQLI